MNTGIQDMINLGWKLALVYREWAKPGLLDTYAEERVPIIKALPATTERATDVANQTSPIVHQLVTHIAPFLLDFDNVREHGARTLSQVNLNYRSISLSKTTAAAGQLRAGDRVPDITVTCNDACAAAPIYSVLDPSSFTFISTGSEQAELSNAGWPSFVKVVRVRAARDTRSKQAFAESFGEKGGIFAVGHDAYLGFAGRSDDEAQLRGWFNEHFHGPEDAAQAPQAAGT